MLVGVRASVLCLVSESAYSASSTERSMFWTVVLTAVGTALLFTVGRNFVTAE